jgi:RNA polymerase sigma factor (sigma-70 family)
MPSFPPTKWQIVEALDSGDENRRREALSRLIDMYAAPLLGFVRAEYRGWPLQDYEDLLQGFYLKCWEKNSLASAKEDKGRFRNFLIASLRNFALNWIRDQKARKRLPAGGLVSAEALVEEYGSVMEPRGGESSESVVERVYQHRVFRAALKEFRERCEADERMRRYDVFAARYVEPLSSECGPPENAELTRRFDFPSEGACLRVLRSAFAEFRSIVTRSLEADCGEGALAERDWALLSAQLLVG